MYKKRIRKLLLIAFDKIMRRMSDRMKTVRHSAFSAVF